MKSLCIVLLMTLVITYAYNIEEIINNVPEAERLDFVRYHVKLGRELSSNNEVSKVEELPDDFSVSMYNYAIDNHQITDTALLVELRDILCFDDGTCIDIGDIGVHPAK